LFVGVAAVAISFPLVFFWALFAGYRGGKTDLSS
jgi:ABC-type dipeptide/oligopeptide/nickel transport system permease subunit